MAVVKAIQPRDTGMMASSRSSVVVERKDGESEDGWARSTRRAVGRLPTCRGICVRDLGLNPVGVDACPHAPKSFNFSSSQILSSHHLYLIIFLDIFHFAHLLETLYYRWDPWIPSSHPHNTIIPLVFTHYFLIQHRTLEKSEGILLC